MTSRSPPIPCEVPQDDRNDAEVEAEVPIASAAEDGNEILSTEAKSRPHLVELFIGDLSYFCTEEDIQKLFSRYGTVVETRIRRSDRGGHSLMFGFVKMTSLEDAERCERELDNLSFMGRLLR